MLRPELMGSPDWIKTGKQLDHLIEDWGKPDKIRSLHNGFAVLHKGGNHLSQTEWPTSRCLPIYLHGHTSWGRLIQLTFPQEGKQQRPWYTTSYGRMGQVSLYQKIRHRRLNEHFRWSESRTSYSLLPMTNICELILKIRASWKAFSEWRHG